MLPFLTHPPPLETSAVVAGVGILVLRELVGGINFGERQPNPEGNKVYDTMDYDVDGIHKPLVFCVPGRTDLVQEGHRGGRRKCVGDLSTLVCKEYLGVTDVSCEGLRRDRHDVIVTGNMFGNIQCLASFAEIDAIHVPWGTVRTEWRKRARHCGTGKGKYSRANFALHWCSCQFETEVAAIEVAVVEVLESGLLTGSCTGTIETVQFPPAPW